MVRTLWVNNSSAGLTGTGSETKVASFSVPANTIGANDIIEIISVTTKVGVGNLCDTKYYFNTSDAIGGTIVGRHRQTSTQLWKGNIRRGICKNATNAQVWFNEARVDIPDDMVAVADAKTGTTIDFSIDQFIVISLQIVNVADVATLESVILRIIRQ